MKFFPVLGVEPNHNPARYGSVGVDINCAVIGFIDNASCERHDETEGRATLRA